MNRWTKTAILTSVLVLVVSVSGVSASPYGDPPETRETPVLRAVYFPFAVIGRGVWFVAKYGIGYPLWFLFQPARNFLYESSEDPNEMPDASRPEPPPDAAAR